MRLKGTGQITAGIDASGKITLVGSYEIDESNETIIHHVEGSISQQVVGCAQLRKYQFEGEKLVLSTGNMYLRWVKL